MIAGELRERVTFDRRQETNPDAPDDYGNTVSDWVEQFTVWGSYKPLRGGETVMAGRLEGRRPQIVRVRRSPDTLLITADWRARDVHTDEVFAIREVTPTPDRKWVELLVESGVAA